MGPQPLQGVRILDLTHSWAAPHCTRLLADYGAEVIRVEYLKRLCPLRAGRTENRHYDYQPAWFHVNRNKYVITLDLKVEADRNILMDLVKISQVVIENSRTDVLPRLGLAYEDLIKIKPDLIMVSMSAFGNSGPYRFYAGYGATIEAISGINSLTGYDRHSKPERLKEMDIIAGLSGACAVMTALAHWQQSGEGQHVDLSQMEGISHALVGEHLLEYAMNGTVKQPEGNNHWKFVPQGVYPCIGEDKWVVISVGSEEEWQNFCEALNRPGWKMDPRFASPQARRQHQEVLDDLIMAWTRQRTHMEAMRILQNHGVKSGAVLDMAELKEDPHLRHRDYFVYRPGEKPSLGLPFKFSRTNGKVSWRGPDLGYHNHKILCELLGRPPEVVQPIREQDIVTAFDTD